MYTTLVAKPEERSLILKNKFFVEKNGLVAEAGRDILSGPKLTGWWGLNHRIHKFGRTIAGWLTKVSIESMV